MRHELGTDSWSRSLSVVRGSLVVTAVLIARSLAVAADEPAKVASKPILNLRNGGYAAGTLVDTADPAVIRWQGTPFVAPFDFAINAVNAISYPPAADAPKPAGEYCFELAGGDVLFGSLVSLNETEAELDLPRFGRLHVDRTKIHRICRWREGADLLYMGPNGLAGWKDPLPAKSWREEQGQLFSDQGGATIQGNFKLPARVSIEFEISWKTKPDFTFALGVDDAGKLSDRAFRFEVWDSDLIACRETHGEADLASLATVAAGAGRIHVQAYLDQEKGRMLVFSSNGKPLADLIVKDVKPQVLPNIQLINNRGDVRLERLRIGRWNGEPPVAVDADKSRIHLADGSIVYGQVTGVDADTKAFVVRGEKGESRIPVDRIASIYLSLPREEQARAIRTVYQDGSRLSGDLTKIENGLLSVRIPGVKETPALPSEGLRSIAILVPDQPAPASTELKVGVLEGDDVHLRGRLVDQAPPAGSTCLSWQPFGSSTASPLRPGISGRIVYRESLSAGTKPAPVRTVRGARVMVQAVQPAQPAGFVGGVLMALGGNPNQPQVPVQTIRLKKMLYLRTGDTIPAEITKIEEDGVWFKTPLSDNTFVAHDKVKAVEMAEAIVATVRLNKSKRERLLTLPRMQKDSPPTHLIRSRNGDYLRGRIVKMDDKTLQMEVRLETKDLPRDRVARIIWLHPEVKEPAKGTDKAQEADKAKAANNELIVQALRSDGIRLTFRPERYADGTLSGKSEVLGDCRVRMTEVDQILIGGEIEKAAAQTAYEQWKLHNAVEPKVAIDDDDATPGALSPGTESALVGKPAPDFELELLNGKKFHLADTKGKVIVLDFWATWCGPCLQAMPQVDKVAREFKDKDVSLVAVNLQESAKEITAMLERHKLEMTVALDRDGGVAEKYAANAIPQTVIIDKDGNIARLFVGGGPHLGDQLREALNAVLTGDKPKEEAKKPEAAPADEPAR